MPSLRQLGVAAVAALPAGLLAAVFARVLRGRRLALCLHRVYSARRTTDAVKAMSHTPGDLDALLDLLRSSRPGEGGWLTMAFDDGYAGAAEYVASRAARYPDVSWLFFVCPEKTEKGAGFRWDLYEHRQGGGPEVFQGLMEERLDVGTENDRADLRELHARPEFRLAGIHECHALREHPNVAFGNHTNTHFKPTTLDPAAFRLDLERSFADFERLFGRCDHFAFPFGHPSTEFTADHVRLVRQSRPEVISWSTEPAPFAEEDWRPGALLPRFPIDGRLTPRELVATMLLATLKRNLVGRRERKLYEAASEAAGEVVGGRAAREDAP